MAAITCWSLSDDTKVIAKPLVPKRPARLHNRVSVTANSERKHDAPDTVKVAVSIGRAIVVYDDVYTLDIDTTTENVCCNKDTLLKGLEGGVTSDTNERTLVESLRQTITRYSPLFL